MLPDRVSNPGPLTYESGALPIALRGPLYLNGHTNASGAKPAGKNSCRFDTVFSGVSFASFFFIFILEISASQTGAHLEVHAILK